MKNYHKIIGVVYFLILFLILQAADGLPCTFHRAFDLLEDPLCELETVIQLGYQRILTR